MGLETGNRIEDLDPAWPLGTDNVSQGDDHVRLVKACIQGSFPSLGPEQVTRTAEELNALSTPTGMVLAFAADISMTGWIYCNGSEVSRLDFADLYAVIGDIWGEGDGINTFNVPEFRKCVLGGAGLGNTLGNKSDLYPATPQADIEVAWLNFFIKT